ncbi:MAG: hypothetical protein ISS47_09235 [Candidatus Omnitrophica bacterium]|nr:hypothetical protein [Candidatus Omnitrophota bacterium]
MNKKQEISFLLHKQELELLKEIIIINEEIEESIERARLEGDKYRLKFSYDDLDELLGFLAAAANHEKSEKKQKKIDSLYDRLNGFQRLFEQVKTSGKTKISTKGKIKAKDNVYVFDIWIDNPEIFCKVLRTIGISEKKNLYNFAKAITQAFGFHFDHPFGFYDNLNNLYNSKIGYELFVDIGEEPLRQGFKGVKKTKILEVFRRAGDKMLFLFDYGDEWHFIVKLKEMRKILTREPLPVLLESIGKAPMQYPSYEKMGE